MNTSMLFFAGNAKLKPFVPSERIILPKTTSEHKSQLSESMMVNSSKEAKQFEFLNDEEDMKEWEAN